MDLPQLLEPERIRCRCDIHSKKRALQTVAELLGAALRDAAETDADERAAATATAAKREREPARHREEKRERIARSERGAARGEKNKGGKESAADASEVSDMVILDALISRERLGSTGLGHGVALPHSRLEVVESPLAAMITLNEGVDFESVDGEPVDIVLGLLVPQNCNDEHLKILANLARRFSDTELRDALREYDSEEELFEHLRRLASPS